MKKYFFISLICCLVSNSCSKKAEKINKDEIVEFSLNYLLSNYTKFQLPIDYINQPLQIIQTKHYKPHRKIYVNGYNCIILPQQSSIDLIRKNMDIFKPLPLVEIIDLELKNDMIYIDIILRATGHNFLIQLKENNASNYKIVKIDSRTI